MKTSISARALMLGAILFGLSFSPAFAEPPEDDGVVVTSDTETTVTGTEGDEGQPDGGDGGRGDDIIATVPGSEGDDNVVAISEGGKGGAGASAPEGGEGGEGCAEPCQDDEVGHGGNGGDGGDVTVIVTGDVGGGVIGRSQGGEGGEDGDFETSFAGGIGGNGGDVTIEIRDGVVVDGAVKATSTVGVSGVEDPDTHGGNVTITISGTVKGSGGVEARSAGDEDSAGDIHIIIDGGVVEGEIKAETAGDSKLTFQLNVIDQAEFNTATAVLMQQQSEGTITINNNTYSWNGFSELVNLLSYVGPNDKVTVSVESTNNVGEAMQTAAATQPDAEGQPEIDDAVPPPMLIGDIPLIVGQPEMAKCSGGSEIRTVRLDTGSLVVIHRTNGADALIGELSGGEFHRATGAPDWTIDVTDQGKSVQVTDASGGALTSCSFS